jgi:DNA helicase HerA-like ATPase
VKAAAETMRANPKLNVETAITELSVGEALISLLDEKGRPTIVERAFVRPPGSRIGPASDAERDALIKSSILYGHYEQVVDRESAYEKLSAKTIARQGGTAADTPAGTGGGIFGSLGELLGGSTGARGVRHEGLLESVAKSAARAVGSQIGREIIRGVLGSILGGGKRR